MSKLIMNKSVSYDDFRWHKAHKNSELMTKTGTGISVTWQNFSIIFRDRGMAMKQHIRNTLYDWTDTKMNNAYDHLIWDLFQGPSNEWTVIVWVH